MARYTKEYKLDKILSCKWKQESKYQLYWQVLVRSWKDFFARWLFKILARSCKFLLTSCMISIKNCSCQDLILWDLSKILVRFSTWEVSLLHVVARNRSKQYRQCIKFHIRTNNHNEMTQSMPVLSSKHSWWWLMFLMHGPKGTRSGAAQLLF